MSVKVYIDGQEGTTGLKILERFKDRNDIEIMKIDEDKRRITMSVRSLYARPTSRSFVCPMPPQERR